MLAEAVGQLIDAHGPGVLYAEGYPTADRVIPWGLFWMLYHRLPATLALTRVQHTTAALIAIGRSHGEQSAARAARRDLTEAFPDG